MDKAGAYAIQGGYGRYIKEIRGEYNNVVGFPVARMVHELRRNGLYV
jgi:septum formation protein